MDIPSFVATQNPELDIPDGSANEVFQPVFKRGQRDRPTINWVVEVTPALFQKLQSGHLYIGFSRCRTTTFEEITQCFRCLKFGHPATRCLEPKESCAKCSRSGHKAADCSNEPRCINCSGLHNALDKSCSSRTRALVNQMKRIDYGKGTIRSSL